MYKIYKNAVSDSGSLGWGLQATFLKKCPGDSHTVGPRISPGKQDQLVTIAVLVEQVTQEHQQFKQLSQNPPK